MTRRLKMGVTLHADTRRKVTKVASRPSGPQQTENRRRAILSGTIVVVSLFAATSPALARHYVNLPDPVVFCLFWAHMGGTFLLVAWLSKTSVVGMWTGNASRARWVALLVLGDIGYCIALCAMEDPRFGRPQVDGSSGLMLVSFIILGPCLEELLTRGVLIDNLRAFVSPRLAVVLTSLIFTMYHHPTSIARALELTIAGLFLGAGRLASGSILPSIVAHGVFNGLVTAMAIASPK